MTTAIVSLVVALVGSVGAFFKWRSSSVRQRRLAEADVNRQTAAREAAKSEIRDAVFSNDDAKLNQIVNRLLSCCCTLVVLGCLGVAPGVAGCAHRPATVVYVPADRRIETVTNSVGVACKAVPNAVMAEMLEKLQELQDLKTELKVDKRVSK